MTDIVKVMTLFAKSLDKIVTENKEKLGHFSAQITERTGYMNLELVFIPEEKGKELK